MKYKMPSNRQQLHFLKQLLNTNSTYRGGFIVDDRFCKEFKHSQIQIIQMLNALNSKGLIDMFPPEPARPFTYITITQKAFAYIPDVQDNILRFWFPILASSVLSVAAIVISILS